MSAFLAKRHAKLSTPDNMLANVDIPGLQSIAVGRFYTYASCGKCIL